MAGSCRIGLLDQKRVGVRIRDATAPAWRPAETATFSCADQTAALVWLTLIKNKTLTLNTLLCEPNWALSMMTLTALFFAPIPHTLRLSLRAKLGVSASPANSSIDAFGLCRALAELISSTATTRRAALLRPQATRQTRFAVAGLGKYQAQVPCLDCVSQTNQFLPPACSPNTAFCNWSYMHALSDNLQNCRQQSFRKYSDDMQ